MKCCFHKLTTIGIIGICIHIFPFLEVIALLKFQCLKLKPDKVPWYNNIGNWTGEKSLNKYKKDGRNNLVTRLTFLRSARKQSKGTGDLR